MKDWKSTYSCVTIASFLYSIMFVRFGVRLLDTRGLSCSKASEYKFTSEWPRESFHDYSAILNTLKLETILLFLHSLYGMPDVFPVSY
jgi:hypothetical protein